MPLKSKGEPVAAEEYSQFLQSIKQRIQTSRIIAYRAVNRELIDLYWNIGKEIAERQKQHGWGKSVVERLSADLRNEIPSQQGFSAQNLWFMRQLYQEYKESPNLLQLVREIPWGQNIAIMSKVKDTSARKYYLRTTVEMGWSRNVLIHQIEGGAFERHWIARKLHNFDRDLPQHLAEQADLAIKD